MFMDLGMQLISLGINAGLTALGYLLIPIILVLSGKKYDLRKLKGINIINCIVIWLLFRILQISLGDESSGGAAVFLWGAVSYWMLKKYCLKEVHPKSEIDIQSPSQSSFVHICISDENEIHHPNGRWNVYGSDIMLEKNTEQSKEVLHQSDPLIEGQTLKYCSHCGKAIDAVTKKCSGCGKQYFRGIPWRITITIILTILLCASLSFNILLYSNNTEKQEEIDSLNHEIDCYEEENYILTKQNERYFNYWIESFNEIAFYDEYIVFVVDDGTMKYHKYDCSIFQNCEGFWAYNTEAAEVEGYEPCSLCSG